MANINYSELAREMDYFIVKRFRELVGNQYMQGGLGDAIGNEFQILLYDVSDTKVHVYEHSEVGFAAAVAAAASGDVILIPPGTISGAHAIGGGVEVVGIGTNAILSGNLSGSNYRLNNLFITEVDPGAAFLYGVEQGTASGNGIFGYGHDLGSPGGDPQYSLIGGSGHTVTKDWNLIGGDTHNVTNDWNVIGGYVNTVSGYGAACFGRNHEITGAYGAVLSGNDNDSTANYAVVIGGTDCIASAANTLAWGVQCKPAHAGAMLFCDDSAFDFGSSATDEFAVRATGGIRLVTAIDGAGAATETTSIDTSGNLSVPGDATIAEALVATPDEITATDGGVAASIDTVNTEVTTNGDEDLDNVTLANGVSGQHKSIYCVVAGHANDTWKITPATMCGGTQITFSGAGEGCTLRYADNEGWVVIGNNGGTIT